MRRWVWGPTEPAFRGAQWEGVRIAHVGRRDVRGTCRALYGVGQEEEGDLGARGFLWAAVNTGWRGSIWVKDI